MWDLQKTLNHAEGVRKRMDAGLPPFHMTDEEIAESDAFWTGVHAERGKVFDPMKNRQPWQAPPDRERLQAIRDEVFKSQVYWPLNRRRTTSTRPL